MPTLAIPSFKHSFKAVNEGMPYGAVYLIAYSSQSSGGKVISIGITKTCFAQNEIKIGVQSSSRVISRRRLIETYLDYKQTGTDRPW